MADPINIQLEVDLSDNGGMCRFTTLAEVESWVTAERQAWSWLAEACRKDGNLESVRIAQSNHWQAATERVNQVRNHTEPQRDRFVKELGVWFQNNYGQKKVLHSACARAKHVEKIRGQDSILAVYVLGYYLGVYGQSPMWQRGAFLALAQEYGLHETANAERAQLAAVQGKWDAFKVGSEKVFSDFQSQFTAAQQAIESERIAQKEQWQKTMAGYKAGFDDHIKTARGELDAIARTYDEKLALQASVRYWRTRAMSHGIEAVRYRRYTFRAFGVVAIGLLLGAWLVVGNAALGDLKLRDVQFWKLSIFAIIATVGIWTVRILVRLLLSHVHLATDASERRTMLLTYLAMMRKQQIPETKERQLILQALFRPTSTGIVKDDASPPFIAEWVKRVTGD